MAKIPSLNRVLVRFQNSVFGFVKYTPPIRAATDSPRMLYSIVGHRTFWMYILAYKSLARYLAEPCQVLIQSDGTLDERSIEQLTMHIPGCQVQSPLEAAKIIEDSYNERIQSIVTNEATNLFIKYQLAAFFTLSSRRERTIHFDADMLFPRRPAYILNWLESSDSEAFHFPGGNTLVARFKQIGIEHRLVGEFNAGIYGVPKLPEGCAVTERLLERIASGDPGLLQEWQAAQGIVAAILAETSGSRPLGGTFGEKVATGWSSADQVNAATVIHFVGTTRFRRLYYPRLAMKVCRELRTSCRSK